MKIKSILSLLIAIFTSVSIMATTKPDFAFPKKVEAQSEKMLKSAIKSGDSPAVMRALMNLTLARSEVAANSLSGSLAQIEKVADETPDAALAAMLTLLRADIYAGIYADNSWKYNERQLPLSPLPENFTEWSGDQFRAVTDSLLRKVTEASDILGTVELKEYSDVLKYDSRDTNIFPTLLDFATFKSISIMRSMAYGEQGRGVTPAWYSINEFKSRSTAGLGRVALFTVDAMRRLLRANAERPAARFYDELEALELMDRITEYSANEDDALFNARIRLYRDNSSYPFSVTALLENIGYGYGTPQKKEIYTLLKEYSRSHGATVYDAEIEKAIRVLTSPEISVQSPSQTGLGRDFSARVHIVNCREASVDLYTVNSQGKLMQRIDTRKLVNDIDGPFEKDDTLTFRVNDYGNYALVPRCSGSTDNGRYISHFCCSDLFGASVGLPRGKYTVYVADAVTGCPVTGAQVTRIYRNKPAGSPYTTDADGAVRFTNTETGRVRITRGADTFLPEIYTGSAGKPGLQTNATVTTSLPLYHFGDEMEWAAVIYNTDNGNASVADGSLVNVEFRDANYQQVDTVSATTDTFGRITGKLSLPADGLAGRFSIIVRHAGRVIGRGSFTVSDYRLPTFTAEVREISIDKPGKGDVTITGIATSYSGFPISDASVTVNMSSSQNFFWFREMQRSFFSDSITTDASGHFTLTVPADVLAAAPFPKGVMRTDFDVTSSAGETRRASCSFSMGYPYGISAPAVSAIDIDRKEPLGIKVVNPMLEDVDIPLICKVMQGDSLRLSFELDHPVSPADLSALPTGVYSLKILPADTTLAAPAEINDVILYHPSMRDFPIDRLLWTPSASVGFDSREGEILIGTGCDNLTVNMIVVSADSMLRQQWIALPQGLNKVKVTLPEGIDRARVRFTTVNNFCTRSADVTVTAPEARRRMTFAVETFRDKVSPLSTETWRFRTCFPSGTPVGSAVMLNLFSEAINDVMAHSVPQFHIYSTTDYASFNFTDINSIYNGDSGNSRFDLRRPEIPEFQTYGLGWMARKVMMMRARAYNSAAMMADTAEETEMETAVPLAAVTGAVNDMKMAKSEAMDEAAAEEGAADAGSGSQAQEEQQNVRPAEIPLAFFQPMLTTDADGNLEFSFTYPDANTTWTLNGVAYDRQMHSASMTRSIVASRPLMVQSNMPRFLRQGDTASLPASVMNNTDSVIDIVTVTLTAVDVNTGLTVASATDSIRLGAKESAAVCLPVEIPASASSLLVTVKASDGVNSDGEQTAVAVMPASQRVIESHPFYMAPDSSRMSLDVNLTEPADVTLEFCENPAWTVVTALPGLRADSEFTTSPQAAAAIFSAAVADGIIRSNPEIEKAMRQWLASEKSDSVLVSMLEKNADLKTVLLSATPWMVDAMNDTQRMTRLALLFDRKETDRTYRSAINALARMKRDQGGWSWTDYGDTPSEWATENVLLMMGELSRLGFMPKDKRLDAMITDAVKYIDSTVAKRLTRRGTPETDRFYTYMRLMFPGVPQSTAARRVSQATVNEIVGKWKKDGINGKAADAIILAGSGYRSTAALILKSLSEFSSSSPERGIWWENLNSSSWWAPTAVATTSLVLDAYKTVDPSAPEIDGIRQWLILEKSRQDWGSSATTSMVIASILTSGSRWTAAPAPRCAVRVNSDLITPDKFEKVTGYIRADLDTVAAGPLRLTVDKTSPTPAYGALYCSSVKPMAAIRPSSVDGLSVEKRFLVRRSGSDGIRWEESSRWKVGDVVKVVTTVKCGLEMSYVAITDERPACLEPLSQLPQPVYSQGICFYRVTRNSESQSFIDFLPKGTYVLEQEFSVSCAGVFTSGVATVQSQYAPQFIATSAGTVINAQL